MSRRVLDSQQSLILKAHRYPGITTNAQHTFDPADIEPSCCFAAC